MEALFGIGHLSLKTGCLDKNIALSVEETLATAKPIVGSILNAGKIGFFLSIS